MPMEALCLKLFWIPRCGGRIRRPLASSSVPSTLSHSKAWSSESNPSTFTLNGCSDLTIPILHFDPMSQASRSKVPRSKLPRRTPSRSNHFATSLPAAHWPPTNIPASNLPAAKAHLPERNLSLNTFSQQTIAQQTFPQKTFPQQNGSTKAKPVFACSNYLKSICEEVVTLNFPI